MRLNNRNILQITGGRFFILMLSLNLFFACQNDNEADKEPEVTFSVSSDKLDFEGAGSTKTITVNVPKGESWTVDEVTRNWLTVTPSSGLGSGVITVVVQSNPYSVQRLSALVIRHQGNKLSVSINQTEGENVAPTKPQLISPVTNDQTVIPYPEFKWLASTDINKDAITYKVAYSKNQTDWTVSESVSTLSYALFAPLEKNTKYYWKVIATDARGAVQASDILTFTTSDVKVYADGEYYKYTADPSMNGPIPLIFTGDGFIPADYVAGGLFDQKIDEGIAGFFDTEPYKSFRNQFTVYKVAAHSKQRGATRYNLTDENLLEKVNTAFDTRYYGDGYNSTLMKTNTDRVYQYAQKIPNITTPVLNKTTIVLVVNSPIYSGTCWMDHSGRSVSIVPTCDAYQPYTYKMTMAHEAGGHGFGQLADEYLYANRAATDADKNNIVSWSTNGANSNIDVTGDRASIKWKHFFGVAGYESVSAYEGAQFLSGVWMPESSSNMRDMRNLYYNAPSREAIVKRIMLNLGNAYTFDYFKQVDKRQIRSMSSRKQIYGPLPTKAHTPPQYVTR